MATVLEECNTEEQRSVVRFFSWAKALNVKDIHKCFLFTVGSVCRVKQFTAGSRNVANVSLMTKRFETALRKWLRQQSKDFYAAGFDALVK
jgi:hypothetical protein